MVYAPQIIFTGISIFWDYTEIHGGDTEIHGGNELKIDN
jgi:hypothetical protein